MYYTVLGDNNARNSDVLLILNDVLVSACPKILLMECKIFVSDSIIISKHSFSIIIITYLFLETCSYHRKTIKKKHFLGF